MRSKKFPPSLARPIRRSNAALLAIGVAFAVDAQATEPAQPGASPFRTAQALYEQAESLRKRGELAESCALYRRSVDVYQSFLGLCGIARCLADVDGKLLDGIGAYERARAMAEAQEDIEFATARIATLEPQIAYLDIALTPPNAPPPTVELLRKGRAKQAVRLGEVQRLDPGEYELLAPTANGVTERTAITLGPGEHKSLVLTSAVQPTATARVVVGSVKLSEGPSQPSAFYLYGGAAVAGIGLLSIGYGIGRGSTVWSKRDAMQREGIDDASYNALVREARDARTEAMLLIAGGSAVTLVGVSSMLYYWGAWPFRSDATSATRVNTALTPGGISIWGTF